MRQLCGASSSFVPMDLTGYREFTSITTKFIAWEAMIFPGGEPHVKITKDYPDEPTRIYARITDYRDLGTFIAAVYALRYANPDRYISAFIPYFPGARQDRLALNIQESFDAKIYADIINNLKLNEVIIFDPHSNVTPALINNCVVLTNEAFFRMSRPVLSDFMIVCPDKGAISRTEKLIEPGFILYMDKKRDMKTGKLSGFKVMVDEMMPQGITDFIVVDDICDGGGTFIGIADVLKELHPKIHLHLMVSHGIFSQGFNELKKRYRTITTTNSFMELNHSEPCFTVNLHTIYPV